MESKYFAEQFKLPLEPPRSSEMRIYQATAPDSDRQLLKTSDQSKRGNLLDRHQIHAIEGNNVIRPRNFCHDALYDGFVRISDSVLRLIYDISN